MVVNPTKAPTEYSEQEAAIALGISVEELRVMVRDHIVKDGEVSAAPLQTYRASDVWILRVLTQSQRRAKAAGAQR